ncbi:MAG TPA: hypothetical protein VNI54_14415 [Thermoanaerobaculia bacterium]|nr:hypothetical protein [Thermoanaerobaculia bacterium]
MSILLLLTLAGCASNTAKRPANIPQPDLGARLVNPLFFGSSTEAAATIEVGIRNRAAVPIILRRVEIASPGMGQYTILARPRDYRETIAPGEEKVITAFATAIAQTTTRPTEPLSLRVIVEFTNNEGAVWREILMLRER